MTKRGLFHMLSLTCLLALLAGEFFAGYQILSLGMVPEKYLVLLFGVFVLLTAALAFLALPKGEKPVRRIIAWVLTLAMAAGCFAGGGAVARMHETIDAVTNNAVISDIIGLYVRKEDTASTVADLKGGTLGVNQAYDWVNTQRTLEGLSEELEETPDTKTYPNVFAMLDGLYAGEVDGVILNTAFLSILEGVEPYADFESKTRQLWTFSIKEIPTEPTEPSPQPTQGQEPADPEQTKPQEPEKEPGRKPFILYLSGLDTRSAMLATSRSDVNILGIVNPETKQILLVNTPRDYYVPNPAGGGALDKLTHCGVYGIDCSIGALEGLYGIDIDYYAQVNFAGFETLVDAVGGVTIYSDVAFTSGTLKIQKGYNELNGEQATKYARQRYAFADGDHSRGRNQMKLIKAILEKLTASTLISRYSQIMDSMEGMFVTSMPKETITEFVKQQLNDMSSWNILNYAVSGSNGRETTFSAPDYQAYVMHPDQKTVEYGSELIRRVLDGEILTQDDLKVS